MERVRKEGFGMVWLEKRECVQLKEMQEQIEQKLLTLVSRDNGIKTDVLVVVIVVIVVPPFGKGWIIVSI